MTPPLQGVRILEMSQAIAGPVAARTLGDLGAEILKIEQPNVGDMSRRIGPHFLGGESAYYLNFNRNKKSVTIDLRTPKGREVCHRLVAVSDVVFDAFRPSVLERLGLDYESLKAVNPTIIACSLSAFGQEGPYRERPGFDGIVQAMGGGMSVTGNPDQPPVFMGFPVGDMVGGYVAALSIASALYGRRVTGVGRRLDISLLDVQIALQAHLGQFYLVSGEVPQPIGSGHPSNLPVGAYQCADGKYVQVHCASQEFAMKTLRMMSGEVEELQGMDEDPRFTTAPARIANRPFLEDALTMGFGTKATPRVGKTSVEMGRARRPGQQHRRSAGRPTGATPRHGGGNRPPLCRYLPHRRQSHQVRHPRHLRAAANAGPGYQRCADRPVGV